MSNKILIIGAALIMFSTSVVCNLGNSEPEPTPEAEDVIESTTTPTLESTEAVVEKIEEVSLPPTVVAVRMLTAQEAYDILLAEALAWQPDAKLHSLLTDSLYDDTSLDWMEESWLDAEGRAGGWSADFWSPSTKRSNSISFTNEGTISTDIDPEPNDPGVIPIALDSVILDSKRVYDIAAAAGGSDYLGEEYDITAHLYYNDVLETTWWYIDYSVERTSFFHVIIDASSGEVIEAETP